MALPPQATLMGVISAAMFFVLSNTKPLGRLSAQRPHPSIFCAYVFLSLLGQFLVHLAFLAGMYHVAKSGMSAVRCGRGPSAVTSCAPTCLAATYQSAFEHTCIRVSTPSGTDTPYQGHGCLLAWCGGSCRCPRTSGNKFTQTVPMSCLCSNRYC